MAKERDAARKKLLGERKQEEEERLAREAEEEAASKSEQERAAAEKQLRWAEKARLDREEAAQDKSKVKSTFDYEEYERKKRQQEEDLQQERQALDSRVSSMGVSLTADQEAEEARAKAEQERAAAELAVAAAAGRAKRSIFEKFEVDAANHLSGTEAAVREVFDELDADGSGFLETNEIGAMLDKLGLRIGEQDVAQCIEEMEQDASKDGKVDFVSKCVLSASFGITPSLPLGKSHAALQPWRRPNFSAGGRRRDATARRDLSQKRLPLENVRN